MEDPLKVRVAHAELVHVLQRIADIVDCGTALPNSLRDEARAAVQVELAHVGRMRRIGEKRERANTASPRDLHLQEARRINTPQHFAITKLRRRDAYDSGVQ